MISRKLLYCVVLVIGVASVLATTPHHQDDYIDDEFYLNEQWDATEVSGASISSFFDDEEDRMEFDPQDDISVHGFSTETEPAENSNKKPPGTEEELLEGKDDEVDPRDADMSVDKTIDDMHVSGLAFVETDQVGVSDDFSEDRALERSDLEESVEGIKADPSTVSSGSKPQSDEALLDEVEHEDITNVKKDVLDDHDLRDYGKTDENGVKLDNIAVDDLEGVEEIYRDSDVDSVLSEANTLDGVAVKGQAVLTSDDEMKNNYVLEVEGMDKARAMVSGSGMEDDFIVTGQSVKLADDEDETEFDDDEESDDSEELFFDTTERREKANIERLFEDSVASLEL